AGPVRRRLGGEARPGARGVAGGGRHGPPAQSRDEAGPAGLLRQPRPRPAAGGRLPPARPPRPAARLPCACCLPAAVPACPAGHASPGTDPVAATLAEDFAYRPDRPTYHPAHLEGREGRYTVRAVPWFGSADLRGLVRANALLVLPAGDHQHKAGGTFPVVPL